jgi:hypothetical protein
MSKKEKSKTKKLTVGIFVDFMRPLIIETTPEDERKTIKKYFKEFMPEIDFVFRDLRDLSLDNENFDILVVDYGGIMLGSPGLIDSYGRRIEKFLENNPNSILIIWTFMTKNYLEDSVANDKFFELKNIWQYEIMAASPCAFWEKLKQKLIENKNK